MDGSINRQILLIEKPTGKLGAEHFRLVETKVPEPKDGEALLRVRYISLDAANSGLDARCDPYRAAVETNYGHGRRRHRRGRRLEGAGFRAGRSHFR